MTTKDNKNSNIGTLGERFIQARLDVGISFDDAWYEWDIHQRELTFVMVECPEVRHYNDPLVCDAEDRRRIRKMARKCFGRYIDSANVSRLAVAAGWINIRLPKPRYEMDESAVRDFLLNRADEIEMEGDLEIAIAARSDEVVEHYKARIEEFANEHSLWAVPSNQVLKMWRNSISQTDEDE